MVKRLHPFYLFIFAMLFSATSFAASIQAYVDRGEIRVDESFNLVFEASESVDDDPDFSPLTLYFDILNQSQSSNMQIINGNFSRKTVWNLTLMAKKPGSYTIPSIEFGSDNSPLLTIKVLPASQSRSNQDANLFLETDVDPETAYVQSQIIYTIRLFRAVDIQSASLSEPTLSDADAVVIKLGEDKRYQTTRNNRRYIVIERKYAIFPQQSGKLTISPVEFTGQLIPQRRSFFDPMPFGSKTKRLYTRQVELDIKPIPTNLRQSQWLPAKHLQLSEEWPDNTEFKVGEPITRTIRIQAEGLTAAQIPEIGQPEIEHIKQYPDQPVTEDSQNSNGITGTREEKTALIPTQPGSYTLPAINLTWWNTVTHKLETAKLPSRTIKVTGSASPVVQPPIITTPQNADSTSVQTTEVPANESQQTTNTWFFISLLLGSGWLLTVIAWYLQAQRAGAKSTTDTDTISKPAVKKQNANQLKRLLKSACNQGDIDVCKQVLLDWAQLQWPDQQVSNLNQVSELAGNPELTEQIHQLNQVLYGSSTSEWQSGQLYDALIAAENSRNQQKTPEKSGLPPIFKVQTNYSNQKPQK